MKKLAAVLVACLCLTGCYKFVAEHPEKTRKEFQQDRARCESEAREYMQTQMHLYERQQELAVNSEFEYTRRCMKSQGWKYRLKRAGN